MYKNHLYLQNINSKTGVGKMPKTWSFAHLTSNGKYLTIKSDHDSLSECGDMNTQHIMCLSENQLNLPFLLATIANFLNVDL